MSVRNHLPPQIAELFQSGAPYEVVQQDQFSYVIRTVGFELRFKVNDQKGWEFDEVVGQAFVHIEQMASNYYWAGFSTEQGRVCVNIGAKRAPVTMTGWSEGA